MNTIITNTARALTICIAVTLSLSAADASAGAFWDTSVTGAARKEVVPFRDLDLSKVNSVPSYMAASATPDVPSAMLLAAVAPQRVRSLHGPAIADAAIIDSPLPDAISSPREISSAWCSSQRPNDDES